MSMSPSDLPTTSGIYKIHFIDPTHLYIGSAVNLRDRHRCHLKDLRKGTHHNINLQRAYAKYGEDALHFEIVEYVERREDLIAREQYYFDTLKPCYNIFPYARSGLGAKVSDETRAKLSNAAMGRPAWNKGKPWSDEMKVKLSDAHMRQTSSMKGKRISPERVAALASFNRGRPAWNKGKAWPEEIQERLRTQKIGKPNPHPGFRGPHTFTPLSSETRNAKLRATWEAKSPEEQQRSIEKRRVTMAAKKAARLANQQAPLWENEDAS